MSRIYVASSWRNALQPDIVRMLRKDGHDVYDFRNPKPGDKGFGWSQLGMGDWRDWSPAEIRDALQHPISQAGFKNDHNAMEWADTFVMVLPCGRSAHLELGWACGAGKRALILQIDKQEPELMYLEAERICVSVDELLAALREPQGMEAEPPAPEHAGVLQWLPLHLDAEQAELLRDTIGRDENDGSASPITIEFLQNGPDGPGPYVYLSEYPEEGVIALTAPAVASIERIDREQAHKGARVASDFGKAAR